MDMSRRIGAEFFGTFWLVFGGCGAAVLAAHFPEVGIGLLGVALAFGLTVLSMVYAVGPISGGHFNPAVTFGLWVAGRCAGKQVVPYMVAQVIAAVIAAAALWMIATGKPGWQPNGFAANGYGDLSPGKFSLPACALTEFLMTFFFVLVIIGTTSQRAPAGFAGVSIGLTLTVIHLVSIPVTNTSVNPARSTGPALFAGGNYVTQLWLFWTMPLIGAAAAGLVGRWLCDAAPADATTVVVEQRRAA